VLIIDWDYHHGNGTQDVFYDDGSVLFFSTHDQWAYPGTGDPAFTGEGDGAGLTINVHLDCGATDEQMIAEWEEILLPEARAFAPDFILISAGFDSRQHDSLGCFELTDNCYARLTAMAMELADEYCGGRIVSALEGGYNVTGLASAVVTHVGTLNGRQVDIASARRRYSTYENTRIREGLLYLPGTAWRNVRTIAVHDVAGRRIAAIPAGRIRGPVVDLRTSLRAAGHYTLTVEYHGRPSRRLSCWIR
jgi:acetoin utilization deacetylase AcuC-like enzyme